MSVIFSIVVSMLFVIPPVGRVLVPVEFTPRLSAVVGGVVWIHMYVTYLTHTSLAV